MKKILKSRIFLVLVTSLIVGSIGVYAGSTILASNIAYKDTTVDVALDELYLMSNSSKEATQVATLTTQVATYTMQNDGYITGTIAGDNYWASVSFNEREITISENDATRPVSLYAPKDTVVGTKTCCGSYNLTVYEWK